MDKNILSKKFHSNIPDHALNYIRYIMKNNYGEVLTNILYHGDVLTNFWGRFDQFGDVLTRGRCDLGTF